jgi:hypothetical protein
MIKQSAVRQWLRRRVPPLPAQKNSGGKAMLQDTRVIGGRLYEPSLEDPREPALRFAPPSHPYSAYIALPPLPTHPALRPARCAVGWKGWVSVPKDYLPSAEESISTIPFRSARTRSGRQWPDPQIVVTKRRRRSRLHLLDAKEQTDTSSISCSQSFSQLLSIDPTSSSLSSTNSTPPLSVLSSSSSSAHLCRFPGPQRGWKGWEEVPVDYTLPSDKLVDSVIICSTRTRSGNKVF